MYLFDMISKIGLNNEEMMLAIITWTKILPQKLTASKLKY